MRSLTPCIATLLLLALLPAEQARAQQTGAMPLGLYARDGVLMQAGRPYRAMGVNCFNLFYRTLKDAADKSYDDALRRLAEADIPFVRFMCGGYWPSEWELYFHDPEAYFQRLDQVIRAAEKHRVGLIPSLFWTVAIAPDLVGEPIDQLGNPDSRTIAFIRQYAREVVTRYRESPAILGWEFGNEFNLHADLPNAATHRPPVWPKMKTATSRSQRDELTAAQMLAAFAEFAQAVRPLDPHRVLITGNAVPRICAWHNWKENTWTHDTPGQFETMLRRDNPDPFDTLSVHLYPEPSGDYPGRSRSLSMLVESIQACAVRAGKPLFIGEFGAPFTLGPQAERAAFEELVEAIIRTGVPLSALWVFDYPPQNQDWNVTFDNHRAYMLQTVARANHRLRTPAAAPAPAPATITAPAPIIPR